MRNEYRPVAAPAQCHSRRREDAAFRERAKARSEEHTSELQSRRDLVCRLLLEKKKNNSTRTASERWRQRTTTRTGGTPAPWARWSAGTRSSVCVGATRGRRAYMAVRRGRAWAP